MKKSNQTSFKKEQAKQTMWETWFVTSSVLFASIFFVATLDNSRIDFPNLPYLAIPATINLAICIYKGSKKY